MYKIVALMGKAGAGKDALLKECLLLHPTHLHEIISCTTRPPREGEVEGVNYYYLTDEEFMERLADDRLLEATEFRKWHYGTSIEALDANKINIGVFNPAGVRILQSLQNVSVLPIYVDANDKIRMLRQLKREENPDVTEIVRRFTTDENDFADILHDTTPITITNNSNDGIGAVASMVLIAIKDHHWPD